MTKIKRAAQMAMLGAALVSMTLGVSHCSSSPDDETVGSVEDGYSSTAPTASTTASSPSRCVPQCRMESCGCTTRNEIRRTECNTIGLKAATTTPREACSQTYYSAATKFTARGYKYTCMCERDRSRNVERRKRTLQSCQSAPSCDPNPRDLCVPDPTHPAEKTTQSTFATEECDDRIRVFDSRTDYGLRYDECWADEFYKGDTLIERPDGAARAASACNRACAENVTATTSGFGSWAMDQVAGEIFTSMLIKVGTACLAVP